MNTPCASAFGLVTYHSFSDTCSGFLHPLWVGELNSSTCTLPCSAICIILGNVLCNSGIIQGMECDRGAQAHDIHYIGSCDLNKGNRGEWH